MVSNIETFGPWQGNACAGGVSLVPAYAASFRATGVSSARASLVADTTAVWAAATGLGQPIDTVAKRTDNSMTHPGSPPRGRLR